MAKAAKSAAAPESSGRSARVTRSGKQPADEIGVEDQPTQVIGKRKAPLTPDFKVSLPLPARKRTPVAKKTATRMVPPQDIAEESDDEADEAEEEPVATSTPKKSKKSRANDPTTDIEELKREAAALLAKAQAIPSGLQELQQVLGQVQPRRATTTATPAAEAHDNEYNNPAEEYRALKHHPKQPKIRKRPTPWTEEEEKFLIKLVCERGPKWSEFEAEYAHAELFGRNQTAIKDKARNIMRSIIDHGSEEQWLQKYPMWRGVTVGAARRGVHGYLGTPPQRNVNPGYDEMAAE